MPTADHTIAQTLAPLLQLSDCLHPQRACCLGLSDYTTHEASHQTAAATQRQCRGELTQQGAAVEGTLADPV